MKKNVNGRVVWMLSATFYPTPGGSEISAQRLSKKTIENFGWDVRVLTRRHDHNGQSLVARELVDGIPVVRVFSPKKFGAIFHLINGLWYLIRFGGGGIYHAHDILVSNWLAVLARFLLGGRSIVKLRTGRTRYQQRLEMSLPLRLHFALSVRLADRIIVVNQEVEDFLSELGISTERVVRIPNAVDTNFFHPIKSDEKPGIRRQLGLPDNKRIFLYVGRLKAVKGSDVLLHSWALLPESVRKNLLLLLVGGDQYHDEAVALLDDLDLREGVKLVEHQDDIRCYYWATDCFVLPSRSEGLSNALLEAMACGLPVIASNVGGALDVIEENVNGMFFQSENHQQLVETILQMLKREKHWIAFGERGRQVVQEYAELDTCAQKLSKLYQQLSGPEHH